MKKIFLAILIFAVLANILAGCSEKTNVDIGESEFEANNYEKISLNFKGDVANLTATTIVEKPSVLEVRYSDPSVKLDAQDPENFTYEHLYLVPLKSGTTEAETKLIDGDTEKVVLHVKYKVVIDENLKITFKDVIWEEE
jgi:hypothetical protein